jgi:hypothetical protein
VSALVLEAERVARNSAIFRAANEGIEAEARRLGVEGQIPFLCECVQERCTELLWLSLAEYEQLRSHPARFLVAPGHDLAASEHEVVVAVQDGYVVVEKQGRAGLLVEEADPRRQGEGGLSDGGGASAPDRAE